jgi:hypothetical protein
MGATDYFTTDSSLLDCWLEKCRGGGRTPLSLLFILLRNLNKALMPSFKTLVSKHYSLYFLRQIRRKYETKAQLISLFVDQFYIMAQAKPARRRIVPEQILSPTKSQTDTETLKAAAGPRLELGDLKEHSAVATELLGAGRKVYIDLASYQRSEKEVDWKDVSHI